MFYVILVSHGEFAPGLHTAVKMIAGDRENVLSVSLKDGMDADTYAAAFTKLSAKITLEDRIVLLADIIGGSPLTTAMNVLASQGLLPVTQAFGGMNLPMALTVVLSGEAFDPSVCKGTVLAEAKDAIQEFELVTDEDEDDI
ncbi:PTS system N-acetylgalactosamine-specific IIA component [Sporomusaceae bacterium BoRhaA]|uniref:PTS sugar transporter subunit IIA n=1 Tax=Pelorhabdus rhamnosifermentans TaxID=2772457 RepID=UPI001C063BA4|nr:PTS fructose transporter subunit IIA [Pelorhabdus rhamnosifermentans]MBU2701368.1 PTS system N-acetylgalactosamine-specific IIA component [Pelorhabdus rhamnosifermentans]